MTYSGEVWVLYTPQKILTMKPKQADFLDDELQVLGLLFTGLAWKFRMGLKLSELTNMATAPFFIGKAQNLK